MRDRRRFYSSYDGIVRRFSSFILLALLGVVPSPSLPERPVELHNDTLSAAFSPRALTLQAGDHEATLALVRAGCAEAPRVVAPVTPVVTGGRVVYRHEDAGVEQWFVKEPRGIEQGFTFQGPPRGCASAALRLDMEAGGDLSPAMDEARKRVVFRDASGTARLTYSELQVVDGAGRTLPSAMGLEDGRLALHVDTSDAVYPIVVDPLIGVPGQFISGPSSDSFFGNAVAIEGQPGGHRRAGRRRPGSGRRGRLPLRLAGRGNGSSGTSSCPRSRSLARPAAPRWR
jgi:hypothetical protein